MNRERKTLWLGALAICGAVLLTTELLFRFSDSFNRFVYENSVARDADHFRLKHRLRMAARDPNPNKLGFIGTSITRDGIDVKKFKDRFPGTSFYNLGATFKLPEFERLYMKSYFDAGLVRLVYLISPTDVLKVRDRNTISLYPNMRPFLAYAEDRRFLRLWEQRESFAHNLASFLSETILFREVLVQSLQNAALRPLGLSPDSDFDFYWRQENISDPETLAQKLRYVERGENYFFDRLDRFSRDAARLAEAAQHFDIQLHFYHVNGYCDKFRNDMPDYEKDSEKRFAEILADLPKHFPNVRYHRADAFPCEDYAELFHFNGRGREDAFRRIATILAPELERGR